MFGNNNFFLLRPTKFIAKACVRAMTHGVRSALAQSLHALAWKNKGKVDDDSDDLESKATQTDPISTMRDELIGSPTVAPKLTTPANAGASHAMSACTPSCSVSGFGF